MNNIRHFAYKSDFVVDIAKTLMPSYVPKNSHLITTLSKCFYEVTGEQADCFAKGGASYARLLEHGVAFGPTFSGYRANTHEENESLDLKQIIQAMKIYARAIICL